MAERYGVRTVLGEIKTNFPDARLTTLTFVAEGEWVVVRCIYSGTHRGTSNFPVDGGMLVGVQPTGRTFEVQHMHMYRVLDSKIAKHFANRDDVGMMGSLACFRCLRRRQASSATSMRLLLTTSSIGVTALAYAFSWVVGKRYPSPLTSLVFFSTPLVIEVALLNGMHFSD